MSDNTTPPAKTDAATGTSSASGADAADLAAQAAAFEQDNFTLKAQIAELNKKFNGIDPEEVSRLRAKVKEATKASVGSDPKKLEEFEATLKAEYDKTYGAELDHLRGLTTTQTQEIKELRLTSTVIDRAAQVFKKDMLPLIKREVLAACDFRDGKVVILGDDKKGDPRKSPRNPRADMTIDEFIEELSDRYPSAVESKNLKGGMNGSDKRSSVPQEIPLNFNSWSRAQQVEFMTKNPELSKRVLNGAN